MSRIVLLAVMLVMGGLATACPLDDWGPVTFPGPGPGAATATQAYPTPQSTPFNVASITDPVPQGFTSWQQYIAFVRGLLSGGGAAGAAAAPQVTHNADGTLTVRPSDVTLPDGSHAHFGGVVPNGSRVQINADGTVTVIPQGVTP